LNATPLISVLTVGAGGALGASLRFGLYSVVRRCCDAPTSIATVLANILGWAIAGAIVACLERSTHTQLYATFLLTGVLGAFTTFSAFSVDALRLLRSGHVGIAVAYVVVTNTIALSAAFGAYSIATSALATT
jgi:CrcB protein